MLDILRNIDKGLLELKSGDGSVFVSNELQGRVFAAFGGHLVHRFLTELAKNPDPVEFNNLGGNSLWPAPEGGDFAFNYPPNGDWRVQPGINSVKTSTVSADSTKISVSKKIDMLNRKGITVKLDFKRTITPLADSEIPAHNGLLATGYHSVDEFLPLDSYSKDDVLISAWSLEQFPGAEGIIAFGRCDGPAEGCANDDFYGSVADRMSYDGNVFIFKLGGPKRLQIGVKASSKPVLIGALDPNRGTLVVRMTPPQTDGFYFNMADNDQATGPFGAADMFSIFNGSQELDFHEIETIGTMKVDAKGIFTSSTLQSTTFIFKGEAETLKKCLADNFGVRL